MAQNEGSIVFGLGLALSEEISLKDGAVEQSNFYDYTVMRMRDLPEMRVELIATDNHPSGVGQMAATLVAPVDQQRHRKPNGIRLRHSPFTPERVKMALAKAYAQVEERKL